jgi:hypothetical protein
MTESVSIAVIVVLAVAMSLLGLAIVRRLAPVQALGQHTDVIGFVYAAIGVIYAVILALVVIAAWEDYRDAKAAVSDEATAVLNLARAANGWPSPDRENTEATLVDYARQVVDVEWPAMARGDFGPAMESGSVNRIWHALNLASATAETKSDSYSTALEALDTLGEARGERVLLGQDGLPRSMSVILIIGAVVTIAFTYLFVVETTGSMR